VCHAEVTAAIIEVVEVERLAMQHELATPWAWLAVRMGQEPGSGSSVIPVVFACELGPGGSASACCLAVGVPAAGGGVFGPGHGYPFGPGAPALWWGVMAG
jgi:hypothetical protein